MKIKIGAIKIQDGKLYECEVQSIEERQTKFGESIFVNIQTPFGLANYIINPNDLRKMRTLISCFIENIDLLPDDEEVDINNFVGKKLACTLAVNSEGYLRIQSIHPISKLQESVPDNPFSDEEGALKQQIEKIKEVDGDAFDPFAD
jgi:hypothetical protein